MPKRNFCVFLILFLSACAPAIAPTPTLPPHPSTATPSPIVTNTPPPPTATASASPSPRLEMSPSPRPTINVVMTPDSVQIERWKDYEAALGKVILKVAEPSLCEWEILGRTVQEIYVWAVCTSISPIGNGDLYYGGSMPAAIHIGADGVIQNVEIPIHGGSGYSEDIRQIFPPDVQERYFNKLINIQALTDHLHWRQEHPE